MCDDTNVAFAGLAATNLMPILNCCRSVEEQKLEFELLLMVLVYQCEHDDDH